MIAPHRMPIDTCHWHTGHHCHSMCQLQNRFKIFLTALGKKMYPVCHCQLLWLRLFKEFLIRIWLSKSSGVSHPTLNIYFFLFPNYNFKALLMAFFYNKLLKDYLFIMNLVWSKLFLMIFIYVYIQFWNQ
jgi:hypothetical protein